MMEEKEELLDMFTNGITVGELIEKLKRFDASLIVVNDISRNPIGTIEETDIDYCFDEIITKHVLSIY